jgi:two-component system cell cycle sensor histidine kinase/response regulator CckA
LEAGYNVLVAEDGSEALSTADAYDGPIGLLLTDVIMPKVNGRELAERLHAQRPSLRTLFMSGYSSNVIAQHGVIAEDIDFLDKPFSRRELLQRVRAALDNRQND